MTSYVARRLIQAIPLLIAISMIVFGIVELAPGDAAQMYINPDKGANPAYIAQVRESLAGQNASGRLRLFLSHTPPGLPGDW
jgi:peptide/nickel transport system permease protein